MLLHLAQSKFAWKHAELALAPWAPAAVGGASTAAASDGARPWARGCFAVDHLGWLNATCAVCSAGAPTFSDWHNPGAVERATQLTRHRVQTKFRGHILYADQAHHVRLQVRACSV